MVWRILSSTLEGGSQIDSGVSETGLNGSMPIMRIESFVEDQVLSPERVAAALRTTRTEIAGTLGLGRDAFNRASRIRARKTQTRLRQMLEILNRVEPETGSLLAAYAWFRSEPLPGFGGMTPDQLVRDGRAEQVHAWLDRVKAGGYA